MTQFFSRLARAIQSPIVAFTAAVLLLFWLGSPVFPQTSTQEKVFGEVWQTVNEQFFDPNFNGVDWAAMREKYKSQAAKAPTSAQFAAIVNQMLGELKTSHTRFYTPEETAYYQLLGIFQPDIKKLPAAAKKLFPNGKYEYTGIGVFTKTIDNKTFVNAVLDGSPAATAGLKVGDQILSVNGSPYHPILSFAKRANQPLTLQIQRSPDPSSQQTVTVTPKLLDATTLFLDAQRASTQILPEQGKRIGYLHIWSNAADFYQEQMVEALLFGKLRSADGLVLDLRDGWGGGSATYLNFFTGESPSITSIQRGGREFTTNYRWTKPVVVLINEGSRSSKEIVAYGFQKSKSATLVGAKTAGAVVAGSGFVMQDGSLLYLAVADVRVDGEQRLEGKGVTPDIPVAFPLEYAQGKDPQKEQAIAALLTALKP